ncbi:hypothetical protein PHYBOEH_003524 [Phytophthora boehmeriae]|uniref:Uncharacterized protein n=1 Tax=Phytophthora boehmeriae TaxID=109152 RepID=A0A8T1X8A9_9STRA|nr:hypothetical protein PHYBOEH_003524 [Phytophthora boehmeriae]
MGLLWTLGGWATWLALRLASLTLELVPVVVLLLGVIAVVLVSAMTAQALEYGLLASVHGSKWHKKASSYATLRRDFYRGYWLLTLLYVVGSSLWIYFTERTNTRVVYGTIFCAVWWGIQLAMIIALAPLDKVLGKVKAALR